MTESVYVPGLGFRSANGLRMPSQTIARQDDRALAVTALVSSETGTELGLEIHDERLEDACIGGKFDHLELYKLDVRLRDDAGNAYARSDGPRDGIGLGQHEFGFFQRRLTFTSLSADVRRVVIDVDGAFGRWTVPVELLPIAETGVPLRHEIDAAATKHGIDVRLLGVALGETETMIEVEANAPSTIAIRGIGAEIQRQGDDRLVLVDGKGRRYEEELSRDTTRRPRDRSGWTSALFPPLPADATELTLIVPSVIVEDVGAKIEFTLPMNESREVDFGPYPVRLGPASLANDLLDAPGKPAAHGLRFAIGPARSNDDRRAIRPLRVLLDGVEHRIGFGWHPDRDTLNISATLAAGVTPSVVTLERPVVSIRGPWEIRFDRPV